MVRTTPWEPLHDPSTRAVAIEVLRRGPISRADVARRLNLSAPSLSRLTATLLDRGIVVESGVSSEGRMGRPMKLLNVRADAARFVGIKLRENELIAALTDLRGEILLDATRTVVDRDPAAVVGLIAEVVHELGGLRSVEAIGIGVGGLVRHRSSVESAPFLGWEQVPLAELTQEATGIVTVVDNDLIAFTEYERWFGPAREDDRFAVVTLGIGTGYGLVANGEIVVDDAHGLGLVAHWPLDPFGPLCPKGHRGCVDAVLSPESISWQVGTALRREVGFDECLDLAMAGQPAALAVVTAAGRGLGRLLATICNLTMPQRIILGGEGVRLAAVAEAAIHEGIASARDHRAPTPPIHLTDGGNREWCRGAAALAIQATVLGTASGGD